MILLLQYTLLYASVLTLVALGGCYAEHAGVINLGLEGTMVIGAMGGALTLVLISEHCPNMAPALVILLTVLVSVLIGVLYSLLLAVASVTFSADQTIVGTAMNMLGTAAATVIVKAFNMSDNAGNPSPELKYGKIKEAFIIKIGSFELNWFTILTVLILIIAFLVLYRTRFGLRMMACGEHPQAADSVGINVAKMRYAGVMISGALGGLGGIAYITAAVSQWDFTGGVTGFGFLALAVMIFGQWKPFRIALAALLFGMFNALSNVYVGIDFFSNLPLPGELYRMLPYIISLLILAFTSKNSHAPKAEGIPYNKSAR